MHQPEHPVGHGLPAAARGPHRAHERHVDDLLPPQRLAVVPAAVVHHLAHELKRRLCAVGLALGHVEVVDEDDELLAWLGLGLGLGLGFGFGFGFGL